MDEFTIELDSEKYEDFLRCITMLAEVCNDVDIQEGIIRQRSNGHYSVFRIDARPVLGDITLAISHLKFKIPLFSTFSGNDVTIDINSEGDATFRDEISSFTVKHPSRQFLQNAYMDDDDYNGTVMINEDEMILSCDINTTISERIKVFTKAFNVSAIQIGFSNDMAHLRSETQSKDQSAIFKDGIILNQEFTTNAFANIGVTPFRIDHDGDIAFRMYKESQMDRATNHFEMRLGDMDVNIYSKTQITFEEGASEEDGE
jgi:hypothetical protein